MFVPDIGKIGGREWRRGGKDSLDLYFGGLCVGGAHNAVLGCGEAVERADRVRGIVARDLGVGVAHKRMPDFDGTTTLEDVHPDRAPSIAIISRGGRWGQGGQFRKRVETGTGTGHSLGERLEIGPKELEERVGIRLDVELHLSLFHNLRRVSLSDVRGIRGARLTSKPASEIRNSISNLYWSAWCLIMATVRVVGVMGLKMISPGAWLGDEGTDIVFDRIA